MGTMFLEQRFWQTASTVGKWNNYVLNSENSVSNCGFYIIKTIKLIHAFIHDFN